MHLYGDPASVPHYLCTARQFMRAHGYLKPIIVGEHADPQPFEFPDAVAVMQQVFAAAFSEPPPAQSTGDLAAQAGQDTPERRAMAALYARMSELPPTLQMFMEGCPTELEAKRHRLACRQVVQRTLLALAGGVHRTAYWNLAPEYPGPVDHLQMMHLLIGKLPLLGYTGSRLGCRRPTASTFALLADQLASARAVTRVQAGERPMLHAFEADRPGRGPLLVLWDHRDAFGGEDEPPVITTQSRTSWFAQRGHEPSSSSRRPTVAFGQLVRWATELDRICREEARVCARGKSKLPGSSQRLA